MENLDWDSPLEEEVISVPATLAIAPRGRKARPHGVVDRRVELRDGVEFLVEVHAPESFPPSRRIDPKTLAPKGGKVGKYASPKPKSVVAPSSGSGLWTGSQGERTLLNSTLRHKKSATLWAKKHGSLEDAPWEVIGMVNLLRAVRAARTHEEENCPVYEIQHVLDDLDDDLRRLGLRFPGFS